MARSDKPSTDHKISRAPKGILPDGVRVGVFRGPRLECHVPRCHCEPEYCVEWVSDHKPYLKHATEPHLFRRGYCRAHAISWAAKVGLELPEEGHGES